MKPAAIIALASTTAAFIPIASAVKWHFSGRPDVRMNLLSVTALATFAMTLFTVYQTVPEWGQLAAAVLLQLGSMVLFASAVAASRHARLGLAFGNTASQAVCRTGPYRWIRHPFYASYMLFWLSCIVVAPHWAVAALTAIMAATYVIIARQEEQTMLRSPLGAEYGEYFHHTGRFLPRFTRRAKR